MFGGLLRGLELRLDWGVGFEVGFRGFEVGFGVGVEGCKIMHESHAKCASKEIY